MKAEIDLHSHSTASDGTLRPKELVAKAAEIGLRCLALTDHDTTAGLAEALAAGKEYGVEIIPGCELSVDFQSGIMHIVGLWISPTSPNLNAVLECLRDDRLTRNQRILQKLANLGICISYDELSEMVQDEKSSIGRPHIARVLIRQGIVPDVKTAFQEYLGTGKKAYVPKMKLPPEVAIETLKADNATVILAHPYSLSLPLDETETVLKKLQSYGLDGLEVYYPLHSLKEREQYGEIAERLGLLVSGGSDFHGSVKPDISLGTGKSNLAIPYEIIQKMKDYRTAKGLPLVIS